MNLAENLYESSRKIPDQVAITLLYNRLPDQAITFRDLYHGSEQYARFLIHSGVKPGDVIILILQHGQDLVYAFWGSILLGAIPSIMPFLTDKLLPDQYRASLVALFQITKSRAVITYPEFASEVNQALDNRATPPSVFITDQVRAFDLSTEPFDPPGLFAEDTDVVLLQHSSGTTGLQKGVALSHQAVFNQLHSYSKAIQLDSDDVVVSWLPLYHDMGLIAGFIMPILCRIPLVLMSPFDWVRAPVRLLRAITDFRGSLCWLPNFAYNFCAQKIRNADLINVDLSSLRAVINCSEPIHHESHQLFLERFKVHGFRESALASSYAMAENVFAVTQGGIKSPLVIDSIDSKKLAQRQIADPYHGGKDSSSAIKMVSCGKPIDGTQIMIINSAGQTLPQRFIGEVAIQSNCMLSGYFNRPDITQEAFQDGWYLSGDLGYIAEGELFITGRKKDLIIVGGKNIYPQDIERLAGNIDTIHPGRLVAFGVYSPVSGTEEVILVAELDHYNELSPEELDQVAWQIRQTVTQSSDITLRSVHLVERNWLIKTSSGKISRPANREKYLNEFNEPQVSMPDQNHSADEQR